MTTHRNILFIPSGSIGDAVMIIALSVEIYRHNPGTSFTIIARRNAGLITDLALGYPFLRVIAITRSFRGLVTLVWEAFRRPYAAFMPGAFGKSWFLNTEILFRLLALRPGTRTFGLLKREGDSNPYTIGFVYGAHLLHIDNLRRLAQAARFFVDPLGSPIELSFRTQLPATFPFTHKPYIVYHPFGSSSWKSFPPRRSRELLAALAVAYPSHGLVITGGLENEIEAQQIAAAVPGAFVATGLPIREAIGIIKGSALYIGVDTGTLHLASVLQHPVIALEHNASPEWAPTYDRNAVVLTNTEHCECDGVKNDTCLVEEEGKPYMRCLYEITDESILRTTKDFLK